RARMALDYLPFGDLAQIVELATRPLTDVELEQPALDANGHATRARNRPRGLARALERRRIDRGDALELWEPRARMLGLFLSFVAEMQPWSTPGKNLSGRRRDAMSNEQDDSCWQMSGPSGH